MSFLFKKITTALALLSFVAMVFFSFASMSYGADGRMQGDCPFSNMGTSLCPQNALPGAVHHLSAYQSFLNAPVHFNITVLLIALLAMVATALVFLFHPLLYRPLAPILYSSPPFTSHDRKIKRWLSLFEHSPSR